MQVPKFLVDRPNTLARRLQLGRKHLEFVLRRWSGFQEKFLILF